MCFFAVVGLRSLGVYRPPQLLQESDMHPKRVPVMAALCVFFSCVSPFVCIDRNSCPPVSSTSACVLDISQQPSIYFYVINFCAFVAVRVLALSPRACVDRHSCFEFSSTSGCVLSRCQQPSIYCYVVNFCAFLLLLFVCLLSFSLRVCVDRHSCFEV